MKFTRLWHVHIKTNPNECTTLADMAGSNEAQVLLPVILTAFQCSETGFSIVLFAARRMKEHLSILYQVDYDQRSMPCLAFFASLIESNALGNGGVVNPEVFLTS